MQHSGLRTGQLAKKAKVNTETLRYYEKRGLIPTPPRRDSGYRIYPETTVDRLNFIKGAQSLGFTLDEILDLLQMRLHADTDRLEVRQKAQEKVVAIQAKIKALQAMEQALNELIEQCHGDGSTTDCPILDAIPSFRTG